MSKKILCILMLVAMLIPSLVACTTENGKETATAPVTTTTEETKAPETTPEATPTPTKEPKEPLPSASTLVGSKYMPPVDNQGSIGSCSAESVTYMQFTIAVAQYMDKVLGNKNWNPSSGNKNYIFSPKFSFVYSGAGTGYSYDILVDQGCLPVSKSTFKKNGDASVLNDPMSRRWDVGTSGLMAQSLKYRLSNYNEVGFEIFNYDFTTTQGKEHIEKMKRAIYEGNAVSVCGWSSFWEYVRIDENGLGTSGKKGDYAIWAGIKAPNQKTDGNHAVCFVGYDDDITCTVAGVTMKGAFCLANSWGQWMNKGCVWVMYDSLNRVSSHPELAEKGFYSDRLAFHTSDTVGEARIISPLQSNSNMQMIFTKTSDSATIEGVEYPVYTIQDRVNQYYLGYTTTTVWKNDVDENCAFALIPFSDYSKWSGYKLDTNGKINGVDYKDSFLICAVNKYKTTSSPCFLMPGNSMVGGSGRNVEIVSCQPNKVSSQAFMIARYKSDAETFESSLKLFIDFGGRDDSERTGVLYRSSFVYWDKDVVVDAPNVILEVEIEAIKREGLWITLYRCDSEGNLISKVPQVIKNSQMATSDMDAQGGETRFDGVASNGSFCKGYLAFGFNDFAALGEGYDVKELYWGVNITGNLKGVKVKGLKLTTLDGTVLSEIKVNDGEKEFYNGHSRSFIMAPSEKITEYSAAAGASGILFNNGAEKYLNIKAATLSVGDSIQKDAVLKFTDAGNGSFYIYDKEDLWLVDISGKELKDGVQVKYNKFSENRAATQKWTIEQVDRSSFRILLASDPSYCISFGSDGKLCLTKDKDSKNTLWSSKAADTLDFKIKAERTTGETVKITGKTPDKYESGDITVKITAKDGSYVGEDIVLTPKEDGTFETEVTLENGTYLFSPYYQGEVYGFEYVITFGA